MKREIEGYVIGRDDFSRLNSMALGIAAIGFRAGMRNPEAGVNAILDALDRMEQRNESLIDERNEARIARNKAEAEIEKLKQPLKVEVGDLVRIVGFGQIGSGSVSYFSGGDIPPVFFKVVKVETNKSDIPCVDVRSELDPYNYQFVWTVPISSIVEVKKPEPKLGSQKIGDDGYAYVYRSSGWEKNSRVKNRRKDAADARAKALSAIEAIPHPSMAEWQTAISMARSLRGLSSLDKCQIRNGKDRRKS